MGAGTIPHPSDETLDSYRSNRLDEREANAVRKHLDACAGCRGRATALEADPDATRTHVRSSEPDPPEADAASLPPELADHPDYAIRRELGHGGMGVVYLAHNTLLGRDEVLKVIGRRSTQSPEALERFLREIRAVARLRHPNIVAAYSASRRGEGIVFAMEYVEGLDLSKLVRSKGPIPVAHACHFAYQAALGLQHAHENGLVHRDIKPGNLMLSRAGNRATVKILDFGLAKLSLEDGGLTEEGRALGTPHFMAPEQIVDAQSADIRADIYSLGATLYYLLTGRPPFRASSLVEIYRAHVSSTPDRLRAVRPEVPIALAEMVETMMAKEPAKRVQTPRDVADALAPFFNKGHETAKHSELPPDREDAETPVGTARALDSTVRESGWEGLIVFDATEETAEPTPLGATAAASPWFWPSVAFGLVLAGLVVAWASGRFGAGRSDGPRETPPAEESAEAPTLFPKTEPLASRDAATPGDGESAPEPRPVAETAAEPATGKPPTVVAAEGTNPTKPAPADSARDPSAFEPVFNGVDLAGWLPRGCRAGDWLVQDGSLSFRAAGDRSSGPGLRLPPNENRKLSFRARNDRPAVLFTERSYGDFALRLEFRATGPGSGGIVLADLDRGDLLPRYAEFAVSLSDSPGWKAGDFLCWNFGNLIRQVPARAVDVKGDDAWNRLELESRDGSLRLSVNGRQVDYDGLPSLKGPRRIGLRGLSADVRYRNIEIKGRPATVEGTSGQPRLLLGPTIYADDLGDPSTGWGRDDIDQGAGEEPFKRNYERGLYFLQAPPNWWGISAWNAWGPLSQDYRFEVVGRVVGDDAVSPGAWMLILDGPDARGLQVSIDRSGRFALEPSFWGVKKHPNDPRIGPFTHPAIRPGNEWNELTLRVRKRRLEVVINSVRVCEPLDLGWDLLPARPEIAVSKPEAASRIRAEFDWIEIRELTPQGP